MRPIRGSEGDPSFHGPEERGRTSVERLLFMELTLGSKEGQCMAQEVSDLVTTLPVPPSSTDLLYTSCFLLLPVDERDLTTWSLLPFLAV